MAHSPPFFYRTSLSFATWNILETIFEENEGQLLKEFWKISAV